MTATLFNNHVLVMPQGQIIVLEVQHGERAEACWHARRARHSFWMVMSQEALKKNKNNMSNSHEQTIQKLVIVEDSEEINGIKSQVVTLPACMRGWWDGRTHPVV